MQTGPAPSKIFTLLQEAHASVMVTRRRRRRSRSKSIVVPASSSPAPDRLGALPDPLLSHILSFLPTFSAVRTSILSRRWRTMWRSVRSLDLVEDYYAFLVGSRGYSTKRERESRFVEVVRMALSCNHATTLDKLRLRCRAHNRRRLTDSVIRAAVSRRVRTLDLTLDVETPRPGPNAGRLPPLLFACQSLVELRLDLGGSELILPGTISFVLLRRMRLCRVMFSDDHSARALFSCSTALRSLALVRCNYGKLGCLEISCSLLQELAIDNNSDYYGNDGLRDCQVKIAAPHLSSFVYRAPAAEEYIIEPLSCVDYVKIQFHSRCLEGRARSFLSSFSSARKLDICPLCDEALQCGRKISEEVLILFCNLNVLTAAVEHLDYCALLVVLGIVLLNPQLRALTIEAGKEPSVDKSTSLAGKDVFFEFLRGCFEGWNGDVESVEIRSRCCGYRCDESLETVLELVKVLLGSQARLKKLLLSTSLLCAHGYSGQDRLTEKIMTFPRRANELTLAFISP